MIDRDIDYFLVVAKERTLARAAELLGLSQPALSRAIQRVEAIYQLQLVERTARGVVLTAAGERLAQRASGIATLAADARSELSDIATGAKGVVRLAAGYTIAAAVIRALVPRLQAERPAAVIQADAGFNDQILPLLVDGAYDFVVCALPEQVPPSLASRLLYTEEMVPVARAAHPLAKKRRLTMADMVKYPWAGTGQKVVSQQLLRESFARAGHPLPPQVITTNSWETLLMAVARSDCLSIAPKTQLDQGIGLFRSLVQLEVPGLSQKRSMGILWRKDGYISPIGQRAMELVQANIAA
jgi:DNA-binding transcriptional LysR family regulator